MQKQQENKEILDKLKIDFLIYRRKIFDKLAGKKK